MADSDKLILLARADGVQPDAALRVELPGRAPIALFRLGDQYFATDDTCTHGAASLSEGDISDGQVECPFHSGSFDIRTGKPTALPCTKALDVHPVTLENGCVYMRMPSDRE
ncbi:non-heme iron oxygenase ferredoxin subunit [Variovorax paradoxus]|uniref:non-heme iron oxygenase ferredoxin subunit n=1 Tax=Variovorax paradoxus TaxID=34073 RepID=UPI001ABCA4E8